MANIKKVGIKEKQIRLVWGSPDDLPVAYANQLQVSHAGGNEFHLYFGYVGPPLTHGLTEEEIDELPDEMTIRPLSNLVISPELMRAAIKAMSDNLEKYDEKEEKGRIK